jgi:hypothetical protein
MDPQGRFVDPNTTEPITGNYDFGHKPEFKFSTDQAAARAEGWDPQVWRDYQNHPEHYHVEDWRSNRSHRWENKI